MTPYEALDEMTKMFLAAYPYPDRVELPNKPLERAAGVDRFATLAFEHFDMGQASLANVENKRRYEQIGQCVAELFFPAGIGAQEPYTTAQTVLSAFRGKHSPSGGVWFRDVRLVEHNERTGNPPRIKGFCQVDVVFSFTYDDVS